MIARFMRAMRAIQIYTRTRHPRGAHDKSDIALLLSRCDTMLASAQSATNLAVLKFKDWRNAESGAFHSERTAFRFAKQFRNQSIWWEKDTATTYNIDAATLYENVLTIQNAADLEWPATDPANSGVRGEFLLGIFPPDHGGNHAPPTPPAAPAK